MMALHIPRRKPNKYNARKTVMCGHTFDSKREVKVYLELLRKKLFLHMMRDTDVVFREVR